MISNKIYLPSLEEISTVLKKSAKQLIKFSYPFVPLEETKNLYFLKERILYLDGYKILLNYSIALDEQLYINTLQIYSYELAVLPLPVIEKCVLSIMGKRWLTYLEAWNSQKKLYLWQNYSDINYMVVKPPFKLSKAKKMGCITYYEISELAKFQ